MRNHKLLYTLLVPVVMLQACGDNERAKNFNNKTTVDDDGLAFIQTATESGLTEIKASALAETVTKNPRVMGLAKMMITDHTQAGKELSDLASDKFVNRPDTLSVAHQKTIDSLAKLPKADFDKAYLKMMVTDHVQAISLFKSATSNKNNAVQQLAKKILPKLKMHLDSAQTISAALK